MTKKILVIVGLTFLALTIGIIIVIGVFFYIALIRPANEAKAEAKARAAFLLRIPAITSLEKMGEAGMAETIDNNNHCYTYAFQGQADYEATKKIVAPLLSEYGYSKEQESLVDSENKFIVTGKASDGWTTDLQVLNNRGFVEIKDDVIDNPVSTSPQTGQVLVIGQVCNI